MLATQIISIKAGTEFKGSLVSRVIITTNDRYVVVGYPPVDSFETNVLGLIEADSSWLAHNRIAAK